MYLAAPDASGKQQLIPLAAERGQVVDSSLAPPEDRKSESIRLLTRNQSRSGLGCRVEQCGRVSRAEVEASPPLRACARRQARPPAERARESSPLPPPS